MESSFLLFVNPMESHLKGMPRVYLCGPDVFRPAEKALIPRQRIICERLGLKAVAPLDGCRSLAGLSKAETAKVIFDHCLRNIQSCQALLVDISPFRGLHMDPGSSMEVGYAHALGKPMAAYGAGGDLVERIGVARTDVGLVDSEGCVVEDLAQPENIMIALAMSGGCHPDFNAAVAAIALQISQRYLSKMQPGGLEPIQNFQGL